MSSPDLSAWTGCPAPERLVLEGRYAHLEPLRDEHAADLFASTLGRPELFAHLHDHPPADESAVRSWIERTNANPDLIMWAVVDRTSERAGGRQALMRIDAANGVVELGHILWGAGVAQTRLATEAFALHAGYVFEQLGYRRLEWKCDSANAASRRAARRFGFSEEGAFAQHQVVKGRNRDTTWFAVLDRQWPAIRSRVDHWLQPDNFDAEGQQLTPLARV